MTAPVIIGNATLYLGDCRDVMRTLPPQSVNTCISSPPYFGLRDYGVAGQIGQEARPDCLGWATGNPCGECFVCTLVDVYREVRRVLRDDGTCWVNLGDSYAASRGKQPAPTNTRNKDGHVGGAHVPSGLKSKDLMGMPWRVALALQADGWYLRQDIVWAKPNPMPESVRDRCTKAHEYLFLLSKSPKYYFDAEAIAEPLGLSSIARLSQPGLAEQAGSDRVPGKTNGAMKAVGRRAAGNKTHKQTAAYEAGDERLRTKAGLIGFAERERAKVEAGDLVGTRNKRSVWTVATQPYKEAHFATFPPALIEPCVLAGCPVGGTVLDPFGGSGTTGEVSENLGRASILIELSPSYVGIAADRIRATQPGLPLRAIA